VMTILQPLRSALRPWPVVVLRVVVVLLLAGQLYVTGAIERRDLLDPSRLGFDASNYYAAGQRLNVGHSSTVHSNQMTASSQAIPRPFRPRFCRRR
jgi:hypothetical protein